MSSSLWFNPRHYDSVDFLKSVASDFGKSFLSLVTSASTRLQHTVTLTWQDASGFIGRGILDEHAIWFHIQLLYMILHIICLWYITHHMFMLYTSTVVGYGGPWPSIVPVSRCFASLRREGQEYVGGGLSLPVVCHWHRPVTVIQVMPGLVIMMDVTRQLAPLFQVETWASSLSAVTKQKSLYSWTGQAISTTYHYDWEWCVECKIEGSPFLKFCYHDIG